MSRHAEDHSEKLSRGVLPSLFPPLVANSHFFLTLALSLGLHFPSLFRHMCTPFETSL